MPEVKKNAIESIITWSGKIFITIWAILIVTDYLIQSPHFTLSFIKFQYLDFIITYALLTISLLYFLAEKPIRSVNITFTKFRPIYCYLFLIGTMTLLMGFTLSKNNVDGSIIGFFSKSFLAHLSILFILLCGFSSGSFLVSKIQTPIVASIRAILSLAVGLIIMILGLFIMASIHLYKPLFIGGWFVLLLSLGWKNIVIFILSSIKTTKKPVELKFSSILLLLIANLLISINFLAITTPFPLGYDSLTLYMNLPNLISENESLIKGFQPHYWSLLVGAGYSLFKSNVIAQYLGTLPSILSMISIYYIGKMFINKDLAIFSAVSFYTIPIILWQSSFEIKTDLAMLFFVLVALALLFSLFLSRGKTDNINSFDATLPESVKSSCVLVGVLLGFALGIKLTTLISIFSFLIIISYWYGGKYLSLGIFSTCLSSVFALKLYSFSNLEFSTNERFFVIFSLAAIACFFFIYGLIKAKENYNLPLKLSLIITFAMGIVMLPWVLKNTLEKGQFSISSMIEGKDTNLKLYGEDILEFDNDPRPLLIAYHQNLNDRKNHNWTVFASETNPNSGKREEINRYLGYEKGFIRFLSLPYDLTMKNNVKLFSTDIGLFFLILIPLLLIRVRSKSLFSLVGRLLFLLVFLSFSILSVYNPEAILNSSQTIESVINMKENNAYSFSFFNIYISLISPLIYFAGFLTPLYNILSLDSDFYSIITIFIFIPIMYFLIRHLVKDENKEVKSLVLFSGTYYFLWLILSSGIPWYGITGLSLMPLFVAKFIFSKKENFHATNKTYEYLSIGVFTIWLLILIPFKLSPLAIGIPSEPEKLNYNSIFPSHLLQYACNQKSKEESINNHYNRQTQVILNILNKDEQARILNAGAMMNFFITNNNVRIIDDNQLDFFTTTMKASLNSKIVTVNKLKNFNIKYILLDLDIHTMDMTEDMSLRKKVEEFVNFLHSNPNVELVATDRIVIHPQGQQIMEVDGSMVKVKYDIFGNGIIEKGKLALFQIK